MDAVINFFKEFSSMLPTIKVMDIVDILVVAFLIYKVIMMVRSTSAARIAKSVLIILILAGVTQLLNMYLLNYILDKILEIGLVALIVVFQPELRRMLEKLGSKNVREILSVKEGAARDRPRHRADRAGLRDHGQGAHGRAYRLRALHPAAGISEERHRRGCLRLLGAAAQPVFHQGVAP